MDNSNKQPTSSTGPVRTRRTSLPHNAKPYERKRPPPGSPAVNKKKQANKEDEPEGLLSLLKTVITKPLGWIYKGSTPRTQPLQSQPTTTNNTNGTENIQETVNNKNVSNSTLQNATLHSPGREKSPLTSPRRKPPTESIYAPKPAVLGSRKTLTLASSVLHPTHSPAQPKTDHELMIERVAAIPTPIRLKQPTSFSADIADAMECDDVTPSVPINDFNARMSAFFQSKGNAPLTDEERQQIMESVCQPSRFPPEAQTHLRRHQYMSNEIPISSPYANQSPFATRKRALPISPNSNALPYHMQYQQHLFPSSASMSRDYGGNVVQSVPGSVDRFGDASRMDVDRRYDLGERPGKRRDLRSNEERRRSQAMNEYAGTEDSFNAATAERIIQSLQRDNRTPLIEARRAPSSMYSRKGLTNTRIRRGQRGMLPTEELPPSRPLATPIHPPSNSIRPSGPYTKDRRAVKQRAAALAAARKEADEDEAVPFFSSSVSAAAATPVAVQPTPSKKKSATAAQMLAGIPTKGKSEDRLLKSTLRTENDEMEVDGGSGNKKNTTREITIAGEASRAFLTKPPSDITGLASTSEPLFNFTNASQSTRTMAPTPLAAAIKPKEIDANAMDEGDDDGKKQQGFSKRISLKAKSAPRLPPKREKRGFSAEEDVEVEEETIARENALKEIPALPIGNFAFPKPSEPGVFKVPGLPAFASNKPAENSTAASTTLKFPTATDSTAAGTAIGAPVTPADFATVSPSKPPALFAKLVSTPPPQNLYTGPAPELFKNANVATSSEIDASKADTGAKPDTAAMVPPSTPASGGTAIASQPTTFSTMSTTPLGTPTVSKTAPSMFSTNASALAPPPPLFNFSATNTSAMSSKEPATSKENVGPSAILSFGKPSTTTEAEIPSKVVSVTEVPPATSENEVPAAAASNVPSVTSEVPTPARAAFNFGTPVKSDAKTVIPSTPEDVSEMQMSPAHTPSSSKNGLNAASGPPAISFNLPGATSSGGFNFGSTVTTSSQPVISTASTTAFTAPVTTTTAPSGFTGFTFPTPATTTTPGNSGTGFTFGSSMDSTTANGGSGTTTFGSTPTSTSTSTSGPPAIFAFGSTAAPASTVTAPALAFGSTATTATSSAPSTFSFGAPTTAGATTTTTTTTPKTPAFTFGAGAATSSAPVSGFSFAGAAKKEEEANKAPFSFGSGSTTPSTTPTGFTFGSNTTAPPAKKEEGANKTPFSFGSGLTTPSTTSTGFTFGSNATGAKMTFGSGASGFGSTPSTTTGATTTFAFGQPGNGVTPSPAAGGFTFGAPAATGSTVPSTGFTFGSTGASTTGSTSGFQFPTTAPVTGGSLLPQGGGGVGGGGTGFGQSPMPFTFGAATTTTPAQAPQSTGAPVSFQFGTGAAANGNSTGGFSFQAPQQGGSNAAPTTGMPAFGGFSFGTPQPSTTANGAPPPQQTGGMTPFAFGAPTGGATGGGSLFSMGSSTTTGGKRGDGRPIAKPRSKRR